MTTQFEIDCALMAGASYISNRPDINKFPVPAGWTTLPNSYFSDTSSGFEAVSFQSGNKIVISFAGTNSQDIFGDVPADINLGIGVGSVQLLQAAEYYLELKELYPNAEITFTGHSLGGGRAALMGVFFNQTAITFDQAPFAASATVSIRDNIIAYLKNYFTNDDLAILAPELLRFTDAASRQDKVYGLYVAGELLTADWPFTGLSTIGDQNSISHGPTDASATDLHSQALLTAFLEDSQFRQLTYKLPDLLGMIFDSNLYKNDTDTRDENLIDRLVRY
jgi:hypothetical protein